MKRTFATLLSLAAASVTAAVPQQEQEANCPCFTPAQLDVMFANNPNFGCHYSSSDHADPDILQTGMIYLYDDDAASSHSPSTVVQAAVTVEDVEGVPVEGGVCGGHYADDNDWGPQVSDYGDGLYAPAAFASCVTLMQRKCEALCPTGAVIDASKRGCGRMPFALH